MGGMALLPFFLLAMALHFNIATELKVSLNILIKNVMFTTFIATIQRIDNS